MSWIKTSKRLPKNGQKVLIYVKCFDSMEVGFYQEELPLPEPPK